MAAGWAADEVPAALAAGWAADEVPAALAAGTAPALPAPGNDASRMDASNKAAIAFICISLSS
ncbi:hypothetical protein VE23_03260 [Paenibacillus sp. D9]|nr:hypothetical protein VE23_03260 [Paenibacillus sp. D9]